MYGIPNPSAQSNNTLPRLLEDLDALPYVAFADYADLPPIPAVYFFRTSTQVLYIGASINLSRRLAHHNHLETLREVPEPITIAWLPCPHLNKTGLMALEKQAIAHYHPLLNCASGHWYSHDIYLSINPPITRKKSIHLYLRDWRLYRQLTLKALEARTKINLKMLSKYELGKVCPTSSMLTTLAKALDIEEGDLFKPAPSREEATIHAK